MKTLLQAYVDTVYAIDADLDLHPACPLPMMQLPAARPAVPAVVRIQQELDAMDHVLHEAEELAMKFGLRMCATQTRQAA